MGKQLDFALAFNIQAEADISIYCTDPICNQIIIEQAKLLQTEDILASTTLLLQLGHRKYGIGIWDHDLGMRGANAKQSQLELIATTIAPRLIAQIPTNRRVSPALFFSPRLREQSSTEVHKHQDDDPISHDSVTK